jgi:hypothetical protein
VNDLELVSTAVAGIALVVSLIVFVDNRVRQLRAARLARQPALVFSWDKPSTTWVLRNIGNGPALDVVIAQRIDGLWTHPLRMPEMPVDGTETVPRRWAEAWSTNPGLGSRYRSIAGESYATTTGEDVSTIATGPDVFKLDTSTIEPHWQYRSPGSRAVSPRD